MLGYPTDFIDCMLRVNRHPRARVLSRLRHFLLLAALFLALAVLSPCIAFAQQTRFPSGKGGVANLEAKTQSRKGDVTTAEGEVDIQYADTRLRADHVEFNSKTYEATATGHVQLDYGNEHLEAGEAHYNVSTGHGLFHNVRGNVKIERRPNPTILISENPLYFEARDVERFPGEVYLIHRGWITICDPEHPKWQFYAPNARIRLNKTVALVNANFRLFRVPLIWLPYATAPAGRKVRATGFLIPDVGHFVTDYNSLSSLTFRLAFSDSFGEAITSELRSAVFLSNNFRGFSLNFAGLNDKSFLTLPIAATPTTPAVPATSVTLRNLPQARPGSVQQAPCPTPPPHSTSTPFPAALSLPLPTTHT